MDKNTVSQNLSKLKNIPIFRNISHSTLENIFSNSKFLNFTKSETIFLQGEPADYVYIVIDGYVRMFQSNEDGEEMVLKISKSGDSFLEAITFTSKNYPTGAQAIEDVLILSIPASILHKNIEKDHYLAINMLAVAGSSSQELIAKIEQLTLKTATQRIGWFLLRLFVEKESNNKTIELPYDKSLIASYLNMKPETLSRSLNQLKKQGINIGHNVVSIGNAFSLCDYCSSDVALNCERSYHSNCKYNGDI